MKNRWLDGLLSLAVLVGLSIFFLESLKLVGSAYVVFTPCVLAFYFWTAWVFWGRADGRPAVYRIFFYPGYDVVMTVVGMWENRNKGRPRP